MKKRYSFDTETDLIEPGLVAPPLVLLSWSNGEFCNVHHRLCGEPKISVEGQLNHMLRAEDHQIVGQNLPFDMGVVVQNYPDLAPLVWQAYESDRCVDTMVRQKLIDIAHGVYRGYRDASLGKWVEYKYHLQDLAKRHFYPEDLDKDTWRLRYNEFYHVPLEEMPQGAIDYSRHDALATDHVWRSQDLEEHLLRDQWRQSRYHWALHLVSAWGLRTDKFMVDKLEELTHQLLLDHQETLLAEGLLVRKGDGFTKKVKLAQLYAAKVVALNPTIDPVMTDGGAYSLSEDAVKAYNDPLLTAFQEYSASSTIMNRVQELRAGVSSVINTRFDELVVTGRTSSSKPNVQARQVEPTMRASCGHGVERKQHLCGKCGTPYDIAGDRECFVPRKGNVFYVWDVPGLELRTIAQKCKTIIGYSVLADVLNAGGDPHALTGAKFLGISDEEAMRRKKDKSDVEMYLARQGGKVGNFGGDALIGPKGLVNQARTKYDLILTEEEAERILDSRKAAYPETEEFEHWIKAVCRGGLGDIEQLFVERFRAMIPPTEASNTLSQGLGADATKTGLYELVKACYVGRPDAPLLHGCRVVNYPHDEYVMEGPEDEHIEERSGQMMGVLVDAINLFLPDVPVPSNEPVIVCRRWSKSAEHQPNGGVWEWSIATQLGSPGYAQ